MGVLPHMRAKLPPVGAKRPLIGMIILLHHSDEF